MGAGVVVPAPQTATTNFVFDEDDYSSSTDSAWSDVVSGSDRSPNDFNSDNEILKLKFNENASIIDEFVDNSENSSYNSYVIPLKIILPVEHVHKSENESFKRYNYILLKVDDPTYHDHVHNDKSDYLLPVRENLDSTSPTSLFTDTDNVDTTTDVLNEIAQTKPIDTLTPDNATKVANSNTVLIDPDGFRYALGKHYKINDDTGASVVEFDDIAMILPETPNTKTEKESVSKRVLQDDSWQKDDTSQKASNSEQYEEHYAKIFQWLHYHL